LRVMFDTLFRDADLAHKRELWDEFLRFEVTYGNFAAIEKVFVCFLSICFAGHLTALYCLLALIGPLLFSYLLLQQRQAARRRWSALGNAVDPNGIFGCISRFKVLDLFPAKVSALSLSLFFYWSFSPLEPLTTCVVSSCSWQRFAPCRLAAT
jgi:hypothetical protein